MLADPSAVIGIFMIGASAGALVTYARCRRRLGDREPRMGLSLNSLHPLRRADRFGMKSLIVGGDPEMVSLFVHLFREKGIHVQTCCHEAAAIDQLASEKFAAIVLDFDDVGGCANVLKRLAGPNRHVPVFAVGTGDNLKLAADLSAEFLVERPLVPSDIREQMRGAYGRILRDEQKYFRFAVELPVSIRRRSGTILPCTTLNVSQTGMAVSTPSGFTVGEEIGIAFAIPNTEIFVSAEGNVIWDDKHGKAGLSFQCSSETIQARYYEWLHDHFFRTLDGGLTQVDDVEHLAYAE